MVATEPFKARPDIPLQRGRHIHMSAGDFHSHAPLAGIQQRRNSD
jgi:hypothetical protein